MPYPQNFLIQCAHDILSFSHLPQLDPISTPPHPINSFRSPKESDPGSPPLRIDLRHNDPLKGQKISEDLLECTLFRNRHLVGGDIDVSYDRAQMFRGAVSRSEYECRPSTTGNALL